MLSTYTLEDSDTWDKIVKSFKDYDVYWLSGYVKAFKIHGDGEPLLFFYEKGNTRGINVVMKRDIARDPHFSGLMSENTYFDFSSPYGYGGWIIEGECYSNLFEDYEGWCVNNNIISEFTRFHPLLENYKKCSGNYEVIPLGNTIAMNIVSPDIIWNNITSKNRNMIRKAKKNGVVVYSGRYPEIFQTFRNIYNSTMDKDNAEKYYYFSSNFYQSILNDLPQNAQVFYAVYENNIIAASIILAANGKLNYHLSGSIKDRLIYCFMKLLYGDALTAIKPFILEVVLAVGMIISINLKNHFIDWTMKNVFILEKKYLFKIFIMNFLG